MNVISKLLPAFKQEIGDKDSLTRKTVEGGFWTIASSVLYKVIGLIRTIVLARLLVPDDFGLFGIAAVVISGFTTFTEPGVNAMLIHKQDPDKRYWDTGWTIGLARQLFIFVLIWAASALLAGFYDRPRLAIILRTLSFLFLFQGFTNIAMVNLSKTMRFKKKVAIDQLSELVGNLAAIILGLVFRNVWALVVGRVATSACLFTFSYVFLSYRPRLSFNRNILKEFFSFGKPLFIVSVLVYCITNFDDLIVGKLLGIATLGFYTMAYNIANLPTMNITRTIAQVTFPAYSQIKNDTNRVERAFIRVFAYNLVVCVPVSIGMILISREMIEIVLGAKWLPMLTAFRILCLLGLFRATASIIGPLLVGLGQPDYLKKIKICEFIVFAPAIYPCAKYGGIVGVSVLTTFVYFISLVLHMRYAQKILPSFIALSRKVFVIVVGCTLAMALVVLLEKYFIFPNCSITGFSFMVVSGCIIYVPLSLSLISRFLARYLSSHRSG
jgi:O-antigen/teichoic acid export membrane protein